MYSQTTVVLDALDECDVKERGLLMATFDSLLRKSSNPVKIFISSRPDVDIKDHFMNLPNVEIRATDNDRDIAKFVDSEITKNPRWGKKIAQDLQNQIVNTLLEKSQGM